MTPVAAGPSWTQFGGPDRDFKVEASRLALRDAVAMRKVLVERNDLVGAR